MNCNVIIAVTRRRNNMTIKKAIQLAIENGYKDWCTNGETIEYYPEIAFLSPLFWQSLGKALGWDKYSGEILTTENDPSPYWKDVWHYFINHLAEGKSAEEFFKNLK